MVPTFLGIGAPKAGTTWLYQLLDSHPDITMSPHRKEIHYFDLHFERGRNWYEGFFPQPRGAAPAAVGEFTPHYLYEPLAPSRVRSIPDIRRFIAILRNPVDRAFSHYRFRQRQDSREETFEQFLARDPDAVQWGQYGSALQRWVDEFGPEPILTLVFEDAVRDAEATRHALARHLAVDPGRFPAELPGAANEGFVPRRGRLYGLAVRQARWLRRRELDRVITIAKRIRLPRVVKQPSAAAPAETVSAELRTRLWPEFEDEVRRLEQLTGIDLAAWRPTG
jgi:hypothetical protein